MAQSKPLKVNFITQPSQDFNCPICLSLLQKPFLTTCCGGHFCEECAQKVKRQYNQCPLCKETPLNAVVDKYFKRQLEQLMVYCPQKECKWKGELGKVKQHLASDQPVGECLYVKVKCLLPCGQEILRSSLYSHMTDSCPYRDASCQYCEFRGSYLVVTTQHKDICRNYPLTCPNSCSLTVIKRHEMSDHLSKCPEQEIHCSFLAMGCTKVMCRKQLQEHLETSVIEHQALTCKAFSAMQQQHQSEMATVREELAHVKSRVGETEFWINGFKVMADEVKKTNWTVYLSRMSELVNSMSPAITPVIVSLPNKYPNYSIPFYTHSQGYKMLLYITKICYARVVISEVSDVRVCLCIVKGEYDESLNWPFQGKATVLLLNIDQDDNHQEAICNFNVMRYVDEVNKPVEPEPKIAGNYNCFHSYKKKHARLMPYKTPNSYVASASGRSGDSHQQHQCEPVESAERLEFSSNKSYPGTYIKDQQMYFRITIETNSK